MMAGQQAAPKAETRKSTGYSDDSDKRPSDVSLPARQTVLALQYVPRVAPSAAVVRPPALGWGEWTSRCSFRGILPLPMPGGRAGRGQIRVLGASPNAAPCMQAMCWLLLNSKLWGLKETVDARVWGLVPSGFAECLIAGQP